MKPASAEPAIARGYRLTFNEPGIAFFEPGFGTIEPSEADYVEGVLYAITAEELDALHISEGGRAYDVISIPVESSQRGALQAFTFATKNPGEGLLPSKRYLNLLVEGAREHGLSQAWIQKLLDEQSVHHPVLERFFPPLMRFMTLLQRMGIRDPWAPLRSVQTRK